MPVNETVLLFNEAELRGHVVKLLRQADYEAQTYDQIGLFSRDKRLPTFKDNETKMGKKPTGPDYGVFNFAELFATALGVPHEQRGDLIKRFEHKVSDHMPLWLRLPFP